MSRSMPLVRDRIDRLWWWFPISHASSALSSIMLKTFRFLSDNVTEVLLPHSRAVSRAMMAPSFSALTILAGSSLGLVGLDILHSSVTLPIHSLPQNAGALECHHFPRWQRNGFSRLGIPDTIRMCEFPLGRTVSHYERQ